MSLATAERSDARPHSGLAPSTHRRRATVLFVVAAWNVFVWGTRLRNLLEDTSEHSAAFIAVHVVLYVAGFGTAAVLTVMGRNMRREAAASEAAATGVLDAGAAEA